MNNPNIYSKLEEEMQSGRSTQPMARPEDTEIKRLLEENLKFSQAIYADTQKMRRYMFWSKMMSVIWIILVIGPVILAAFWLPSLLGPLTSNYSQILGSDGSTPTPAGGSLEFIKELKQLK